MGYYFNLLHRSDLTGCPATILKHTKKRAFDYLKRNIKKDITTLGFITEPYWISQKTFGAILCDFEPEKTGPSIIGQHQALYELVSEEIDFLVLSRNLTRNFRYYNIAQKRILIININRFKKFIKTFSDRHKRIQLFLIKELTKEEEDIINDWIDSKHKEGKKVNYASAEEIIENLPKDDPEKASQVVVRVKDYFDNQILNNVKYYEEHLSKFEEYVKDATTSELKLRDELKKNIWIIDFKYQNINQFEVSKEFEVDSGKIDLLISRTKTQKKKDIIIELKLAEDSKKKSIIKNRNKDAIGSEVGRALSQLVHYIESKNMKKELIEGIVIIGREKADSFIELFNKYLHGIQIKTYTQLISECRETINAFKEFSTENRGEL